MEAASALQQVVFVTKIGGSAGARSDDVEKKSLGIHMMKVRSGFFGFGGYGLAEERVFVFPLVRGGYVTHPVCVELLRWMILDSYKAYPLAITTRASDSVPGFGEGSHRRGTQDIRLGD